MHQMLQVPKWHVVYTRPRSERKFAAKALEMGVESFLPLCQVVRQWSDRRKKLELPLFPNYVFVKVNDFRRWDLFNIKEMVRFISIEKQPVILDENEINLLKRVLTDDNSVCSEDYFQEGMKVQILYGQFAGMEGTLIKRNGNSRLLIRIERIERAFSFNIPARYVNAIMEGQSTI
jgi:transcription antitermination factor NusG